VVVVDVVAVTVVAAGCATGFAAQAVSTARATTIHPVTRRRPMPASLTA
jgi:hypothetical protein